MMTPEQLYTYVEGLCTDHLGHDAASDKRFAVVEGWDGKSEIFNLNADEPFVLFAASDGQLRQLQQAYVKELAECHLYILKRENGDFAARRDTVLRMKEIGYRFIAQMRKEVVETTDNIGLEFDQIEKIEWDLPDWNAVGYLFKFGFELSIGDRMRQDLSGNWNKDYEAE